LLVPRHNDIDISDEFDHTKTWALVNKLILNLGKTKEIVFRRPRALHFRMPASIDYIEQLDCAKLLGGILQGNLKMDSHIQYILSQCAQQMYLLKLLKHQGMPIEKLSVVAHSLIVSRIPAWGGFLSAELSGKLDAL